MQIFTIPLVQSFPNVTLPFLVVGDREGHQVLQAEFVVSICLDQFGCDSGELHALSYDSSRNTEASGDVLDGVALIYQCSESVKFVSRMHGFTLDVFSQRYFERIVVTDDPDWHNDFIRPPAIGNKYLHGLKTTPTSDDFVHATLLCFNDIQVLQQALRVNGVRERFEGLLSACFASLVAL